MKRKNKQMPKMLYPSPKMVAILGLLALAGYGVYRGSNYLMYRTSLFRAETVRITGNRFIDTQEIRKAAKIDTTQIMYKVNVEELNKTLLKNAYFRGVSVSRVMPATILINVQEREPVFYLADRVLYMVDEEGVILKKLPSMPMSKYPLVTGITARELAKDSLALQETIGIVQKIREVDRNLFSFISEINLGKNREPELILVKGAARVKIGREKHYQRLYLLSQLLEKEPVVGQLPAIKQIDLTFEERIVLRKKG